MSRLDDLINAAWQLQESIYMNGLKLKTLKEELDILNRSCKKIEREIEECKKKIATARNDEVLDLKLFIKLTSTLAKRMKELEACKASIENVEFGIGAFEKTIEEQSSKAKDYEREIENWGKLYEFKAK